MIIYLTSRGRAGKITTPIPRGWLPQTRLVVHDSEYDEYRHHHPEFAIIPHDFTNLTDIRNWINWNSESRIVLHADDDLSFFQRVEGRKNKPLKDIANMLAQIEVLANDWPIVGVGRRLWSNTKDDIEYCAPVQSFYTVDTDIVKEQAIRMKHHFIPTMQDTYLNLMFMSVGYLV